MKIVWSDRAIADLTEIRNYIAEDSEANAIAFLGRLFEAVETLETFPGQGRRVPEAPDLTKVRELLVGNYRIVYRKRSEWIEIVLVVHGRRDLSRLEPTPW